MWLCNYCKATSTKTVWYGLEDRYADIAGFMGG